jgi:hypothetical protein
MTIQFEQIFAAAVQLSDHADILRAPSLFMEIKARGE